MASNLTQSIQGNKLSINFSGELTLYTITTLEKLTQEIRFKGISLLVLDLHKVSYLDTAAAVFIVNLEEEYNKQSIKTTISCFDKKLLATLELVKMQRIITNLETEIDDNKSSFLQKSVVKINQYLNGFLFFMEFFGKIFLTLLYYLKSFKHIRFKEIMFELNESALKALSIVALTSFLIGLVVAFQSAYQLKLYGANIFIVDMLGISILRELAPLITAIVIAGRSGSAFTAQIGAMKITQELDAMKTMGFNPFSFLVLPKIIALMIALPLLIFVADMMGVFGGMLVSQVDLGISYEVFLDRFRAVVDAKHFFIGLLKGPFFAFLIASISIYRGLIIKNDTQSIGINTTKSVVESIFAVIVCDALFSIALTSLGI
ncbi:MlaE family lipid ABC transporter permease subunit [Sulfurimonas sp. SAG-AH-194-C20]|nr:MlaE family lipid ABC transporter permease subunit [Sulfurimonas sp. SAG-AH-194-C20]MDF1878902.1 MlaE family lipid ABC transporter permease subunit [Sulfurimonas sp. SAG-AH-194-C20]